MVKMYCLVEIIIELYKPCIYRRTRRRCLQDIFLTALVHRHRAGFAGTRETLIHA
jgi:hypothetical protein